MSDVLVAGDALVDLFPDGDAPLARTETCARRPGGSAANVAHGLARLGERPHLWTRLGNDPFGEYLHETLVEAGVEDRHVERDDSAFRTALNVIGRDEDAGKARKPYGETGDPYLRPDRLPTETLAEVSWVHLTGIALASEPNRTATMALAEAAAESGCTVSLDVNERPGRWETRDEFVEVVRETLDFVDVLVATEGELAAVAPEGDDAESRSRAVCEVGPHTVLVTLGSDGAFAHATSDAPWTGTARHDGYEVETVDPIGAGDAFVAGAIYALSRGESLTAAVETANAAGAQATTGVGATRAIAGPEDVRRLRTDFS